MSHIQNKIPPWNNADCHLFTVCAVRKHSSMTHWWQYPSYVLEYSEGACSWKWKGLLKTFSFWVKMPIFDTSCFNYHSISVTKNGITKTAKDLRKRVINPKVPLKWKINRQQMIISSIQPWRYHLSSHDNIIYPAMTISSIQPWQYHLSSHDNIIYPAMTISSIQPWQYHLSSHDNIIYPAMTISSIQPWQYHLSSHDNTIPAYVEAGGTGLVRFTI